MITVSCVLLVILMILALFGNIIIWVAFCKIKRLQRVTNYYIVSLATADLLVTVLAMPMWLLYMLSDGSFIPTHSPQYLIWLLLDIVCGTASIMNLTFVSCDRYLAITYPFRYQSLLSPCRAIVTIVFSWVYAIVISLVKLWIPKRIYPIFVATVSFYIPTIIMTFTYSCIFMVARRHVRVINVAANENQRKFSYASELKAAKIIAVVIGEFLLCWGPFLVTNVVLNYCISCRMAFPVQGAYILKLLQYSSSCFNPYLYTCLNAELRSSIKHML
ncbi:predicted protein, partial [Nematostella vectensis]